MDYMTPTIELLERFESEQNPVTKSVYGQIIANRVYSNCGVAEAEELHRIHQRCRRLTYSFESRSRMEDIFE